MPEKERKCERGNERGERWMEWRNDIRHIDTQLTGLFVTPSAALWHYDTHHSNIECRYDKCRK
jgi:hypothetical protein